MNEAISGAVLNTQEPRIQITMNQTRIERLV